MSLLEISYLSKALLKSVTFHMYLPGDMPDEFKTEHYHRDTKILYLLSGYTVSSFDWITQSVMRDLSAKYNIAVVMLPGDNSFYLNQKGTGRAYGDFVGKEIVEYINNTFHLNTSRENTYIGGFSMGGFGAIRTGLKYNETFGKIIGLSSAMIIHDIANKGEEFENELGNYSYLTSVFGPLNQLEESENNPEYLIRQMRAKEISIPDIYMACGTEDYYISHSRKFCQFLKNENITVDYHESPGIHDWKFWNEYLEKAVLWALNLKRS